MSLTHRDLAKLTAWLYAVTSVEAEDVVKAAKIMDELNSRMTVTVLYLSNVDATAVFAVFRIGSYLIVVYRGSYTGMDWIHDLEVKEMDPRGRPRIKRVHMGFYSGTPEAADIVMMFYRAGDLVLVIGHSLGGSRAEIGAEHLDALGAKPHAVVLWAPAPPFKPSTMPAPSYPITRYRNKINAVEVDPVTYSTEIRGYVQRTPYTDVFAPSGSLDPTSLHHFFLYESVTPETEI